MNETPTAALLTRERDEARLQVRVLAEARDLYRAERDALRQAAEVAEQHAAYGRSDEAARVLQAALAAL